MSNVTIEEPVGIRTTTTNTTVMANRKEDLAAITALFDQIPASRGGTKDTNKKWSAFVTLPTLQIVPGIDISTLQPLIGEVTGQVLAFQTMHKIYSSKNAGKPDGAIDPKGPTLEKMNALAKEAAKEKTPAKQPPVAEPPKNQPPPAAEPPKNQPPPPVPQPPKSQPPPVPQPPVRLPPIRPTPIRPTPGQQPISLVRVRMNELDELDAFMDAHSGEATAIDPESLKEDKLREVEIEAQIHEMRLKMTKQDSKTKKDCVYWIGVAVPVGTYSFNKIHVFFHPTTGQNKSITPSDYEAFKKGWEGLEGNYVPVLGSQLAEAMNKNVLIVPFMNMPETAVDTAPANMFAENPVETLDAIMTAIQDEMTQYRAKEKRTSVNALQQLAPPVHVSKVAVSSFSSGIDHMRLFIKLFRDTGLIVEATDFDSRLRLIEHKNNAQQHITSIIGRSAYPPGIKAPKVRVYSQMRVYGDNNVPEPHEWTHLPITRFSNIKSYTGSDTTQADVHSQIGHMMFYAASQYSLVRNSVLSQFD